jgi:hypothetical protein
MDHGLLSIDYSAKNYDLGNGLVEILRGRTNLQQKILPKKTLPVKQLIYAPKVLI